jgi:hypothetical protein
MIEVEIFAEFRSQSVLDNLCTGLGSLWLVVKPDFSCFFPIKKNIDSFGVCEDF